MTSIWFYLLIVIPTLLGFLIGWCAGQAHLRAVTRKAAPPPEESEEPIQIVETVDTCESVLEELQADIAQHTGTIQDLQNGLDPAACDAGPEANDKLRRCQNKAREANADLQAALSSKRSRLQPFAIKYKEVVKDVLARIAKHATRTHEFDANLNGFEVDARTDDSIQALVDQVAAILEQNRQLQEKLEVAQQRVAEQETRLEVAEAEARFDVLTQLPNRRAFEEELERLQSLYNRSAHTFSLAVFDIDRFKALNDKFGHAAGDAVLKMFARVFRSCARTSDHVSRYGGEEFVVLFPHTTIDQAVIVAERYRKNIQAASLNFEGNRLKVTVSAGVAEVAAGESSKDLLVRADSALYEAKETGRNRTCRNVLPEMGESGELTDDPADVSADIQPTV